MNGNTKWTFEICKEEALKYSASSDFYKNALGAYKAASENKWLSEICSHMTYIKLPNNSWTKGLCKEEALKYSTRSEFQKANGSCYNRARIKGWLEEICQHMPVKKLANGYWTKEKCLEEALKYDNYTDFRNNSVSACCAAKRNKWWKEVTSHFIPRGHKYKRFIYAYEFPDNCVYVGLTYNINERNQGHNSEGSVYNYRKESGLEPRLKQLINEPVEVKEAKELEAFYLEKYISEGWSHLNIAKPGSIGGNYIKWDYDACFNEALKYNSRQEFYLKSSSAYSSSLKHNWMDDICKHMNKLKEVAGHWDLENCKQEALKYSKRTDFQKGNSSAYKSAKRNNWLEEVCSHMETIKVPNGYYTLEKCVELAKECGSMSKIKSKYGTAYRIIYKNGWSNIIREKIIEYEF